MKMYLLLYKTGDFPAIAMLVFGGGSFCLDCLEFGVLRGVHSSNCAVPPGWSEKRAQLVMLMKRIQDPGINELGSLVFQNPPVIPSEEV